MDHVWYRDGLRFTCTKCGRCCGGPAGFVWVNAAEIEAIAEFRNEPVSHTRAMFVHDVGRRRSLHEKTNGDCVFYDSSAGCTIYPVRPRQCRTWPFWESNTVTPESWERACQICPGSGKGDLIPAEEITRRINVIKL